MHYLTKRLIQFIEKHSNEVLRVHPTTLNSSIFFPLAACRHWICSSYTRSKEHFASDTTPPLKPSASSMTSHKHYRYLHSFRKEEEVLHPGNKMNQKHIKRGRSSKCYRVCVQEKHIPAHRPRQVPGFLDTPASRKWKQGRQQGVFVS